MIHTAYDFLGAVESARKAWIRTKRARYVLCTAMGYQIVSEKPCNPIYGAWRVLKHGIKAIPMVLVLFMLCGCEKPTDPNNFSLSLLGRHELPINNTQTKKGLVIFVGQSNTPCVAIYGVDSFLTEMARYTTMKLNGTNCMVGGTWSYDWLPGTINYQNCIAQIKALVKADGVRPVAIVYMQGENEATTNTVDWAANFKLFADSIRRDIDSAGISVVWERDNSALSGQPPTVYLNEQRLAQMSANVTPGQWVDTDGIPLGPDGVHYNAGDCPQVGKRFGDALGGIWK